MRASIYVFYLSCVIQSFWWNNDLTFTKFLPLRPASLRHYFTLSFIFCRWAENKNEINREILSTLLWSLSLCVGENFPFHSNLPVFGFLAMSLFIILFVFVFSARAHTPFTCGGVEKFFFFFCGLYTGLGIQKYTALNFHRADASFSTHLSFSHTFFTANNVRLHLYHTVINTVDWRSHSHSLTNKQTKEAKFKWRPLWKLLCGNDWKCCSRIASFSVRIKFLLCLYAKVLIALVVLHIRTILILFDTKNDVCRFVHLFES